ncbi:protein prenylyltransferase [Dendrothele bispora CBS 962.96]|uniref:Protein prenylyltransferase n=1 Tax=Dendrothele bispora (strain CBS 962.96) TaxID=1314807 RepID=A0A4S8M619_DENBC|nr:protein prenylyltransferase [Dendrothele bispora CBS 962.96]
MGKNNKAKRAAKARAEAQTVNGNDTAAGTEDSLEQAGPSSSVPTPPKSGSPSPANATPPESAPRPLEEDDDVSKRAEQIKEKGNQAFKAGKYQEAIGDYTKAIELNPIEPAFLTNRAASYMALKRFRPALDDCQQAATLQAKEPSVKTLLRLARCQLALGSATPASSTLNTVLSLDPKNAQAIQLKKKISDLEGHLKSFKNARGKKDWGMARLALDKCLQGIESEAEEVPIEWRVWKVELELTKGNWENANSSANDALRLHSNSPEVLTLRGLVLFLSGKIQQAITHVNSALRFDPSHGPAMRLRKRFKEVERLKDEGNTHFKAGRHRDAIDKYTEALELVGAAEEEGKGGQIRATLLSNRATTLVKIHEHERALEDTNISLELVSTSFKALRTRGRINIALEKFEDAVRDFKSSIEEAQKDGSTSDADVKALRSELKKAEAALKRSKTKDYYKILGLQRDCTESDIKKAYRRESLKHHPDKGGDEEKFKLVVEAHGVLSDPARRERYDLGEDEDGTNDGMSGGMGGMGGMSQADLANLFAQFNGNNFSNFSGGRGGSSYHHSFSF